MLTNNIQNLCRINKNWSKYLMNLMISINLMRYTLMNHLFSFQIKKLKNFIKALIKII